MNQSDLNLNLGGVRLLFLNNNKNILDYCYDNSIPTELRDIITTVEYMETKDLSTQLVYDYKIYSEDINLLEEIVERVELMQYVLMEKENTGPIDIYSFIIGDTLDLTFYYSLITDTTINAVREFHQHIINCSPTEEIPMTLEIQKFVKEHQGNLTDLVITTNLFKLIAFPATVTTTFQAIFNGELDEKDYIALAVILGKSLNGFLDTTIIVDNKDKIELDRLIDIYCKLNHERKNQYLSYNIESTLNSLMQVEEMKQEA